jgi:hypothetical protein
MTEIYVRPGEKISSGKVIGLTGGEPGTKGAGRSSGPHLHFEYYKTTKSGPSDPKPHADKYFRFGGNVTVKKKVTSQTGVMGQNGAPTVVLAAGTNTYGDPKKAAADVKRSVEELKKKGYNVVVVPPSEQGVYGNVSKAVQQAATESGATIEKGRYDPNDPTRAYTHLDPNEAKRIREKYKGATFMGDSNAVRIAGGFDVAGLRVTGAQTDTIAGFAKDMKSSGVSPSSQVQGLSQQPVAAQRLQQYPTYNTPQNSVTIVPMMMGGGGGGSQQRPMVISSGEGGGTTIMPPVPQGQVLNSLFNTMLLTNLSGS